MTMLEYCDVCDVVPTNACDTLATQQGYASTYKTREPYDYIVYVHKQIEQDC